MESQQVQLGSVAFVLVEAILRELGAKVTHHPVASYLGDHTRGGDAQTDAVPIDDGSLRKWKRNDRQSINQDMIRRVHQGGDRHAHCPMTRAQNVDAIDLDGIDNTDLPSHFGIGYQIGINLLAQFRRQLFGIVQTTMTKFLRQNDSGSHNRTRKSATPGFVNSGDPRNAGGAQFFFVTKSAPPVHFRDLRTRRFNDLTNSLNHSIIKSLNDFLLPHYRRFLALAAAKII
jgi:hypothetical protein